MAVAQTRKISDRDHCEMYVQRNRRIERGINEYEGSYGMDVVVVMFRFW
jgi:hypothetical protein